MVLKEFSLEGKVALVTGAGRGIGQGIALCLAEAGADVVAAARTSSEIEETAQGVRQMGRRALAVPTDVTRADQVEKMVKQALKEFGQIDILVNNAGGGIMKPFIPLPEAPSYYLPLLPVNLDDALTPEEWHRQLALNLTGVYLCTRAVAPHMLARRQGKIINIVSTSGVRGRPYLAAYSAAKGGVALLTRSLALEWAKFGIRVNAVSPGLIATPQIAPRMRYPQYWEERLMRVPLGRAGTPRDVALLAVYLASEASSYVTGQMLIIDGGNLA